MPTKRISFHDFDSRLWLSGGRDQVPQNGLRRCVAAAPELTRSIQSRWGSNLLYNINAISVYEYNGNTYQYDGTNLYQNGVQIDTGYNGTKLTFMTMPP